MRILIVDDEPPGVKTMRDLLEREPEVELLGECYNGEEAREAIKRLRPDLVFLDVQMPGLDGFGVLANLPEEEMPLVVFVTAYDQYSLKAFSVHALDYLLKPPGAAEVRSALRRAGAILEGRTQRDVAQRLYRLLEEVETGRQRFDRFVVRQGERVRFVEAAEIEAIEATGNYMLLHSGRNAHIIRDTMDHLEQRLDPTRFVRTHRSWMVNADRIKEILPSNKGVYVILVQGGTEVPVSRHYRARIDQLVRATLVKGVARPKQRAE
jgi:two-component system LytT family response regulator